MDIKSIVEEHKAKDNRGLWDKIGQVIESKSGKWDHRVDSENPELTQMLIYEYATSLEQITKGKLSAEFVAKKLATMMGTFRFGDFKEGQDDNITYGEHSVTSEGYKKHCRINSHFGAHQVDYEENGRKQFSVVMFDGNQQYQTSDGQTHKLSGGKLYSLDDIRQTIFHEWTHVMEKCLVKTSELTREDVIKQMGDSVFINAYISADLTMEQYKAFIADVDRMLDTEDEILFGGISTVEINERKSSDRRIMHNIISEGATELISKRIMQLIGGTIEEDRYEDQANFVEKVFESIGSEQAIATYLTSSNQIISYINSKSEPGHDLLRETNTFLTALGNFERTVSDMIKAAGNDPKVEFEKVKNIITGFWNEKRRPTETDVETVFDQMKQVANIPEAQIGKVKGMTRFALDYPARKKEYDEMIESKFPAATKVFSESVIRTVEESELITQSEIDKAAEEIVRITMGEPAKIGEEQKQAIEAATRKCVARLGEGAVSETQIQGLLSRMYKMKDVKEAIDSLTMNVNKFFGRPGQEEMYDACLEDILEIEPTVYHSKEELIAQLQRNLDTNYTPGNISIEENHTLIEATLKTVCDRLNAQGVDYYVVGALSTFIATGTPLFRYHGDIDFMVSEEDLPKVQAAMKGTDYEFSDDRLDNQRRLAKDGSHAQGEHEVIANHKDNEFHLGYFLFRREPDGAITVREYFMREENGVKVPRILERHLPKELAELEYSSEETEFAGTRFRCSTPESVIAKKEFTRHPKDILDIEKIKGKMDPEKRTQLGRYHSRLKIVEPDEVSRNIPRREKEGQSLED